MSWSAVFAILLVAAFLTKAGAAYSRVWLVAWYAIGYLGILLLREGLRLLVRQWVRQGRLECRVVVVGGGERGAKLIDALESSVESDVRICGFFDDRDDERVPDRIKRYPKLGSIDELVVFARESRVDMLVISLPLSAEERLSKLINKLWVLPTDIRLSAHDTALRFTRGTYSYLGTVPVFNVYDKPLADWDHVLKTLEDRVLSALALVALAPLFALIALAIKLDSRGPVFFRQNRHGFNNDLIEVFKFRTLRHDRTDRDGAQSVSRDDDRVTRVGRWLRRSSFDELPQLFNVLRGEMSIVGPRPHALMSRAGGALFHDAADGYFARHRVKPGMTGWAQINGWRGETDTEEKIQRRTEFDLYYIDNWSLAFDLMIIIKTPFALMRGENAF